MAERKKIFYGWFLLVAVWLVTACSTGMFVNSMTQFQKPVCEAMNITRAQFSLSASFISIAGMLLAPFVGKIFEKFNPRLVVTLGSLLMLTGWFGFSFVPDITSFYVMAIIIGIGSSVSGAVVVNIILNNWFHAKKGFAMGFASTGSGFGSMVFNPLGSALIVNFGYQAAFRGLGVCAVLCLLPILLLFVYKPEYKGLSPYGESQEDTDTVQEEGCLRAEALRSPRFWGVCFIVFGLSAGGVGIFSQMAAYFTDIGYSAAQAAAFVSMISLSMAISKIFFGWLNDRVGTYKNFMVITGVSIVGIFILFAAPNRALAYLSAILFGVTLSSTNVMTPLITVHAMGSRDFANIFGIVSFFLYVGSIVAPPFSAVVYDTMGSYTFAFFTYAFLYIAALVIGVFALKGRSAGEKRG